MTETLAGKPTVTTMQLVAALDGDALARTKDDLRFTDRYGVTYSGRPAHVTLAALQRDDITPDLDVPLGTRKAVRIVAGLVAYWFANTHTPAEHAETLSGLSPELVCRIVAYMVNNGDFAVTGKVGPKSLAQHTAHLLAVAEHYDRISGDLLNDATVHAAVGPTPRVVDADPARFGLALLGDARNTITARTADDSDTVTVHADVAAHEEIRWEFPATFPYPVDQLHHLLTGTGQSLGAFLNTRQYLISGHLTYDAAESADGIYVAAQLAEPERGTRTIYLPGDEPEPTAQDDST